MEERGEKNKTVSGGAGGKWKREKVYTERRRGLSLLNLYIIDPTIHIRSYLLKFMSPHDVFCLLRMTVQPPVVLSVLRPMSQYTGTDDCVCERE